MRSVQSDGDDTKKKSLQKPKFQVESLNVVPHQLLKRRGTEGGSTDMS